MLVKTSGGPLQSSESKGTILLRSGKTGPHFVVEGSRGWVRQIVNAEHEEKPAILDIQFVLESELHVLVGLGGCVKEKGGKSDAGFGHGEGVREKSKTEGVGRVVPVIEAGHCEEGLVSGGRNSREGFDPHSDHPGFSEIDAVRVLQTH